MIQLNDMFLLIETEHGIRLVDQHALHEKALFLCLDPTDVAAGYTSYADLKKDTAQAVVALLEPVQQRYAALAADPHGVNELLDAGRDRAAAFAAPRLDSAMRVVGLVP